MGKRSRDKGAAFENEIAKKFSYAYGLEFRRTPLSGGWAKDADIAQGDIVCIDDDEFPYLIECKKQEGWTFESLFTSKHSWFDKWWGQAVEECPESKEPLLVFSKNYAPVFIAIPCKLCVGLVADMFASLLTSTERVTITDLDSFLEWDKTNWV